MKKILVTGGIGFVGRTLVRQLYGEHEVVVVDNFRVGHNRLSASDLERVQVEAVDVRDAEAIGEVLNRHRPDVVIHLAAVHFIPECERDPKLAISTNVIGTVNLLSQLPPECRFVLASSGAVYAPSEQLHQEDSSVISPKDVYGFTKLQAEEYVRYYAEARNLQTVIVRLFNVVGPGETNPHLLPELIIQLKAGKQSIELGNLWPKRDYIHVRDAASGFAAAALNGEVLKGQPVTVNLGTSRQYSVSEIVERLRLITGLPISIVTDEKRLRKVDRPFLGADITKISAAFGWTPSFDLDTALQDVWANPDIGYVLPA